MTTLVIEFRKLECNDATKCTYFYSNLKALIMKATLIMYLNQSILQLYETYKSSKRFGLDSLVSQIINI